MSATAVFMPAVKSGNAIDAIEAALAVEHIEPGTKLYTNGERLAWLPQKYPGWFLFGSIEKTAQ